MTSTDPIPPTASPRRSSRWRALVLLLFVFLLGAACGIGGGGIWLRQKARATFTAPAETEGPAFRIISRAEARLAKELSLGPDERAAVKEELTAAAKEVQQLREDMISDGQELARKTVSRIEQRLPPEKRDALRAQAQKTLAPWGIHILQPEKPQ